MVPLHVDSDPGVSNAMAPRDCVRTSFSRLFASPIGDSCKFVETGFKSSFPLVWMALTAGNRIIRIELVHIIRKVQLLLEGCIELSFVDQFYSLAGKIRPV